jgi:hypothetical protein
VLEANERTTPKLRIRYCLAFLLTLCLLSHGCFDSGEIYLESARQRALAEKGFRSLETGWPPLLLANRAFPSLESKARVLLFSTNWFEKEFYPFFVLALSKVLRLNGKTDVTLRELFSALVTHQQLEVRPDVFESACSSEIALALRSLAPAFFNAALVDEIIHSRIRLTRFRDVDAFILPFLRKGTPVFVMMNSTGSIRYLGEKIASPFEAAHLLLVYGVIEGAEGYLLLVVDPLVEKGIAKKIGCDYGIFVSRKDRPARLFPAEYEQAYSPVTCFYLVSPRNPTLAADLERSLKEIAAIRGFPLPGETEISFSKLDRAASELRDARLSGREENAAEAGEKMRNAAASYEELLRRTLERRP